MMLNYSNEILKILLNLSERINLKSYFKVNNHGIIDQQEFVLGITLLDNKIPQKEAEKFYYSTLTQFSSPTLTLKILYQLLLQPHKKTAESIKPQQKNRSLNEIFILIAKNIQSKEQDIETVFKDFDKDKDNVLNEREFKTFLEQYSFPTISEYEYSLFKNQYSPISITLQTLKSWIKDSKSMEQNNYNNPKLIASQQQKNMRSLSHRSPQKQKDIRPLYVHQSPQKQLLNQTRTKIKAQDYEQQREQLHLQQQLQLQAQQKQLQQKQQQQQQQPPQSRISVLPEQNQYEDPTQEAKLNLEINFESFVIPNCKIVNIQTFLQIFNKSIRTNEFFTDLEFPANAQSLGSKLTEYNWKRLRDIWPSYEIFVQNKTSSRFGLGKWISPKDIFQGSLGDCYFLSVASSLVSRWPDFLLNLFITQKANPSGIFSVRLCIDGMWKAIILDDYIPVKGNEPAFSSSKQEEIWVLLLEKAWAKSFGSYSNIISGDPGEVIRSLTGCPAETIKTDSPKFKERFIKLVNNQCLMTTGTISSTTTNQEIMGLIYDHAYSILKLQTILHPIKGEVTLIKLRNPWGQKVWRGEWSDDSPSWTEKLKKKLRIQQRSNDGVFYMSYQDFIRYFNTIDVGYFKKDYFNTAQTIVNKSNESIYFIFNNDTPGEYYFMAQQKSLRHYQDQESNYKYSPIRMIVAQQINQGYIFKKAKYEKEQQVFVGDYFEQGQYVLQVKVKWQYMSEGEFVISAYGPKEVNLTQIDKDQFFMKKILFYLAKRNPEIQKSGFSNLDIISEFHVEYGIGYEYYQNTGNENIEIKGILSVMQGLKLKKPERGNQYQITLKPQSNYLIAYTMEADGFQRKIQREYFATQI
ncbi:unnamed protein product (macronuclear) [Paramecium tetraurelia]|uniref:Calpain catalytic domain-containing protein n=1 Tax=Paramecium tetraurelia TaxID=5888 RepID=A0BHZ1_PARTE|nr:uncharacterized protein GSPATT00029194001 [Paramecium tetraurelia]CAK58158.1 unnamed protein product [Paramecium tetraurelia]|eukprot:XP_001425556.1 hypothetical protein (macronuclear) [Paramecium tetraurelia strain d4-2]